MKTASIVTQTDKYKQLLQDCRQIIVEHGFISRWTLIEGYHAVGSKLHKEKSVTVTQIARDLNRNTRTIQRCVQFYKKYSDLNMLPEGKNTSWHQIVNKYLPETVKEKEPKMFECPNCGTFTQYN